MRAMKLAIAAIGLLAAIAVRAEETGLPEPRYRGVAYDSYADVTLAQVAERRNSRRQPVADSAASYSVPLSRRSALFGSIGLPGEPALGPPPSYIRRFADIDNSQAPLPLDSLDFQGGGSQVFTLGYRWRSIKLEGSAFSAPLQDETRMKTESLKMASRSGRLSVSPAPNLSFQLSRGTISSLDQLEPNGEVRRTTISATYKRAFKEVDWQTTLAWGRNARKDRESNYGYLLESSLRLANAHALFGRVEQVGSDDMIRENDSFSRQMFKVNKLTVGYVYDLRPSRHMGMDVGALMSRHYVPGNMTAIYGDNPVSYMMFVRFRLK
jgi:hypothetical protein